MAASHGHSTRWRRRLAEERGVRLGVRGLQPSKTDTVSVLAREIGVDARTARRRLALAEELTDAHDLAAKVDSGEMEAKRALRVKREREVQQRVEAAPPTAPLPANVDLRLGDFREILSNVPDASVDLILTDPPYPKEYLHLWSALSELAARVLKPGALLIAYPREQFPFEGSPDQSKPGPKPQSSHQPEAESRNRSQPQPTA